MGGVNYYEGSGWERNSTSRDQAGRGTVLGGIMLGGVHYLEGSGWKRAQY